MSGDNAVSFRLDNGDTVVSQPIFNCRVSVVEAAANAGMTVPSSLVRSASRGPSLDHFAMPMGEAASLSLYAFEHSRRKASKSRKTIGSKVVLSSEHALRRIDMVTAQVGRIDAV